MKIYFYFIVSALLLSGCGKDKNALNEKEIKPIAQIPNSNWPSHEAFLSLLEDSVYGTTQLNLYAGISYGDPVKEDVDVTFKPDQSVAESYMGATGAFYEWLPENYYEMTDLKLKIPANTREASIPVNIFPDKLEAGKNYIIAFTITKANSFPVATNYSSMIFTLQGQ